MQANIELGHPADNRSYAIATAILRDLSIPSVRLLTNNPHKLESMKHDGVQVVERVPMIPASWTSLISSGSASKKQNIAGHSSQTQKLNDRDEYLVAKVRKMGHILDIPSQLL